MNKDIINLIHKEFICINTEQDPVDIYSDIKQGLNNIDTKLKCGKYVIPTDVLKQIFLKSCKHLDAYHYKNDAFDWKICKDCILCDLYAEHIKNIFGYMRRDMCFFIWHEQILEK